MKLEWSSILERLAPPDNTFQRALFSKLRAITMSMVHSGWAPKRLSIAKISETMTDLVTVSLLANSRVPGRSCTGWLLARDHTDGANGGSGSGSIPIETGHDPRTPNRSDMVRRSDPFTHGNLIGVIYGRWISVAYPSTIGYHRIP